MGRNVLESAVRLKRLRMLQTGLDGDEMSQETNIYQNRAPILSIES